MCAVLEINCDDHIEGHKMKKITALILALVMIFTLVACMWDNTSADDRRRNRREERERERQNQAGTRTPSGAQTPDPTPPEPPSPGTSPANGTGGEQVNWNFPFDFSTEDIYGNAVTAASLGEKELFFIHFWGTWCPPCLAEMPNLAQLEQQYDDRVGFLMLLDDFDNKAGAIQIYNSNNFYNSPYSFTVCGWTTFDLQHEIMQMLYIEAVPTTIILDADGNLLERLVGAYFDEYAVILDRLLNN